MKMYCLLTAISLFALVSAGLAAEATTSSTNKADCCAKELPAATPLSNRSLYQVDSSWTNDASAALPLAALRGRPQVATMFFASCQFTCPVLVKDMKRIEAALPGNVRTNVGFVLVSFDSERDTPEALAAYRGIHDLPSNWTLLRGAPDDVLELAALLGIKYKKDLRGQFAHSNVITVLDAEGEIAGQSVGLNRDASEVVSILGRVFASKEKKQNNKTD
ncbi:MAG TPA: SCO family protein [Methylomirabilota bacterium]|nr:SCO family protein [Methylomirabilota bacterium]